MKVMFVTLNAIRNVLLPLDVKTDGVAKTLSFMIIIHGHCNILSYYINICCNQKGIKPILSN